MKRRLSDLKRSAALEAVIRAEIESTGPMTFSRFMELALYHPALGYYPSVAGATTRGGDFLTAPECHPVFGAMLARFARAAGAKLGGTDLTVVEQGAGTGSLAAAFCQLWRAAWPNAGLRYVIVEPNDGARERLSTRLGDAVAVCRSLEDIAPFAGVYLSNELPDAFPVHRVRRRAGGLGEVYVDAAGDGLAEVEGDLSAGVAEYLDTAGIPVAEGEEMEANLHLGNWMREVGAALERGYVLTLDYGFEGADATRFPRGTLLAHYRHTANEDFLARVGWQDLTAHVCWTAMERLGADAGLTTLERTTQRDFLTRWGWRDFGRQRLTAGAPHRELDAIDRLGREEDGLGSFGALTQARGVDGLPAPDGAGPADWSLVPPFEI